MSEDPLQSRGRRGKEDSHRVIWFDPRCARFRPRLIVSAIVPAWNSSAAVSREIPPIAIIFTLRIHLRLVCLETKNPLSSAHRSISPVKPSDNWTSYPFFFVHTICLNIASNLEMKSDAKLISTIILHIRMKNRCILFRNIPGTQKYLIRKNILSRKSVLLTFQLLELHVHAVVQRDPYIS